MWLMTSWLLPIIVPIQWLLWKSVLPILSFSFFKTPLYTSEYSFSSCHINVQMKYTKEVFMFDVWKCRFKKVKPLKVRDCLCVELYFRGSWWWLIRWVLALILDKVFIDTIWLFGHPQSVSNIFITTLWFSFWSPCNHTTAFYSFLIFLPNLYFSLSNFSPFNHVALYKSISSN